MDEIEVGVYRGVVEGIESGHCTARIEVRLGPGGCRIVDSEAISDEHGLQQIAHDVLTKDTLHVASGEEPGVMVFQYLGDGVFQTAGARRCRFASRISAMY